MALPQVRHFPRTATKEKTGTKSKYDSDAPQLMHPLLPVDKRPVCKRKIRTFKKLPTINPSIPMIKSSSVIVA